jgi:peptidoglycan/LPS O-acetylase OafA/YrhL
MLNSGNCLKLPFGAGFYAPVMLIVLLHLTLSRNSFLERVSWSKFALLGEMSYALYILQAPMDALYKYVIPGHSLMGQEIHFMLFFIVLASTAFLLTVVEKRVVRRIRVGR